LSRPCWKIYDYKWDIRTRSFRPHKNMITASWGIYANPIISTHCLRNSYCRSNCIDRYIDKSLSSVDRMKNALTKAIQLSFTSVLFYYQQSTVHSAQDYSFGLQFSDNKFYRMPSIVVFSMKKFYNMLLKYNWYGCLFAYSTILCKLQRNIIQKQMAVYFPWKYLNKQIRKERNIFKAIIICR
jgi:hypothetical protein